MHVSELKELHDTGLLHLLYHLFVDPLNSGFTYMVSDMGHCEPQYISVNISRGGMVQSCPCGLAIANAQSLDARTTLSSYGV